jgi:hypothetical protein
MAPGGPLDPTQRLDQLDLSEDELKLLRKLRRLDDAIVTCEHVLAIDPGEFAGRRGVGQRYVTLLLAFQSRIRSGGSSLEEATPPQTVPSEPIQPPADLRFWFAGLACGQKRALRKVVQRQGTTNSVSDLLSIRVESSLQRLRLGDQSIHHLRDLQASVRRAAGELEARIRSNPQAPWVSSVDGLVHFVRWDRLTCSGLEAILIDDMERYLAGLSDGDALVFRSRFGVGQASKTLADLGMVLGLSGERIRQIERELFDEFRLSVRASGPELQRYLTSRLSADLSKLLPAVEGRFTDKRRFLRFLERLSGAERGAFEEVQLAGALDLRQVSEYFAWKPSPCPFEEFGAELHREFGLNAVQVREYVDRLASAGVVEVDPITDVIMPRALPKGVALAHELLPHSEGLHWRDVSRRINRRGTCSSPFSEARTGMEFTDNPHIYYCGNGAYRHVRFSPIDEDCIPEILEATREALQQSNRPSLGLLELVEIIGSRHLIEYYELRRVVRDFGTAFGIYFTGRSRVDTVSLSETPDHVTATDQVLRAVTESESGLTAGEAASVLRSKCSTHAAALLCQLEREGSLIRVDRGVYMSREHALAGIDVQQLEQAIRDVVLSTGKPVEASVLQEAVERKIGLSRSKYFYGSMAQVMSRECGWCSRYNWVYLPDSGFRGIRNFVHDAMRGGTEPGDLVDHLVENLAIRRSDAETLVERHAVDVPSEGTR